MPSKLTVDELLRQACIYAERDQVELLYAQPINGSKEDCEFRTEIKSFIDQLRKYRMKRWGKTKLEAMIDGGTLKSMHEIIKDHDK